MHIQNGVASDEFYEEHKARLKAEAEAEHATRRLTVAQEQMAEYAQQRESEAGGLLGEVQALRTALAGALQEQSVDSSTSLAAATAQIQALEQKLSEAVGEAKAFAAQQQADADRTKRSYSQANLREGDSDVEMKRMRESEDDSEVTGEQPNASHANGDEELKEDDEPLSAAQSGLHTFLERSRYIPLRLSADERRYLHLLEAALSVSSYTDKVDILSWRNKTQRVHTQVKDICAILSGLVVAQDYRRGQALIVNRNFADNAEFFQDVFEVGRRFKVMNPDRMRSEYGKLMYMLMDSAERDIQELLEFRCVRRLRTVHGLLQEANGLGLLADPLMEKATAEIVSGSRPRYDIQRDIKQKERARDMLVKKYKTSSLPEEDILRCLYSLSDNNSYLLFNRDPVDRMIEYLHAYFRPGYAESGASLAISGGLAGARLTHNHERQFHYVLQSLTLWREISHDMFKLWCLAEDDLLRESNSYRLVNTGQGLNRVQQAPSVSRAMHAVLHRCQQRLGTWVGSSVVHLGDHNVPNALMFIDKYTQVPRILNPVVLVLDALPKHCKDPKLAAYVHSMYGSVEGCRKAVLLDFFRHAFDGSGADNFFDAGSCIDGRLTSAWNWGSKIEKKEYYHIFKICGFVGFDGEFKG
ncbi:g1312 [Coccomyxa viridis]|uniref:G1312 protein n=1 Tax=Coccomyxa viridis TaxID=1274662 RepID=A0ABP1FJD1_9CHLO